MQSPPPTTILLIDDNPNDAELTLTALGEDSSQGVKVVASGHEALKYLDETARTLPSLILLDLNMPHMNGLEVLDAIRSGKRTRDIPVVMLTTSDAEGDIRASYAHGASGYVVKPLDLGQFTEAMQTIHNFWMSLNQRPRLG